MKAMETFLEAREEGKIRHIGFSAHSVEAAMLLMDRFDFDTLFKMALRILRVFEPLDPEETEEIK